MDEGEVRPYFQPHVNVGTIGPIDHGKTTLDGRDHEGDGEGPAGGVAGFIRASPGRHGP